MVTSILSSEFLYEVSTEKLSCDVLEKREKERKEAMA